MRYFKVILGLFVLVCIALLPLTVSQSLGRCLAKVMYWRKSSRGYRVSKLNIDSCFPDLSVEQREQLLKSSLEHTAMSYAEMGMSWLWPTSWSLAKVTSVKGEELLAAAVAEGRGVLIIAPHIGNWEVLNLFASNRYAITVLYKQPKLQFFDWLINTMRKRLGGDMAPANAAGVKKLIKKLRSNGVIAILPDQEPAAGSGEFCSFFGRPAYTMTLLSQLARKTNCKVISGIALREKGGKGFAIEFSDVDDQINSPDISASLAALNNCIEGVVAANPEQYQWEYKRFKKTPLDHRGLY
ncbi:MAG: lysophospholipid acyltransferase family protein [Pseudomonadales bacterium]|nr:lysophospholipid acyltransferase family protein [Pseudomonadales bacterium]NRA15765.1 lysophospholipid acyltransferase family protein [Oceanospirillaceae bacterium]